MVFTRHQPEFNRSDPATAFPDGIETPYSVTVTNARVRLDKNKKMYMPPNLWICKMNGEYHFLPRVNITAKVSDTNWQVEPFQVLREGDVLTVVEPSLTLTIAALAQGATVQLDLNGKSDLFTFAGTAGTTVQDAVSELTAFINNSGVLSPLVNAIANDAVIHLFAKDGVTTYTATVTTAGTITASNSGVFVANAAFGSITMFNPDVPNEIVLGGTAGVNLPPGAHIGLANIQEIRGYHDQATNWENGVSQRLLSVVSGADGVYPWAFPYWDYDCFRRNPKLRIYQP